MRPQGKSGLGLAHLRGQQSAAETLSAPRTVLSSQEARRRRRRGRSGEQQVARLWKQHGYTRAMRQPRSGAIMDLPGDIRGCGTWAPVEVKWNEAVGRVGRGWPGEAFIRATIKQQVQPLTIHGSELRPVLFARSNGTAWRVWVRERDWCTAYGVRSTGSAWVECTTEQFFSDVAGLPPHG